MVAAWTREQRLEKNARDDDYAAVALVRQRGKRFVPELIAGWYGSRQRSEDYPVPTIERLANALDLDGDGRRALVIDWLFYEGQGVNIYTIDSSGKIRRALGAAAGH